MSDAALQQSEIEALEAAAEAEGPDEGAERDPTLHQRIASMPMGEKVKLALKGGREARTLLMRTGNKLLCEMVLKNPRITEDEILEIARNRSVSSEVLGLILHNRDWIRKLPMQLALVQNPKTPTPAAVKLTRELPVATLRRLGKSKDIPTVVAAESRRLLARRGLV